MNKLFSRWKSGPAEASDMPPVDYETAKARAADTNPSIRLSLAERTDMRPEILMPLQLLNDVGSPYFARERPAVLNAMPTRLSPVTPSESSG